MADDDLQLQGTTKYLGGKQHLCWVAQRLCYKPVLPNPDLPTPLDMMCTEVNRVSHSPTSQGMGRVGPVGLGTSEGGANAGATKDGTLLGFSTPPLVPSCPLGLHLQNTYSKIKLRNSGQQLQSIKSQEWSPSEFCQLPIRPALSDGRGELPGGSGSEMPWRPTQPSLFAFGI